jgi:hypothetical protein
MNDPGRTDPTDAEGSSEEESGPRASEAVSLTVVKHWSALPLKPPGVLSFPLMCIILIALYVVIYRVSFGYMKHVVIGLVFVGVVAFLICQSVVRRRCRRAVVGRLPEPFDGARLNAFGLPEELAPLAELRDTSFEPVIMERMMAEWSMVRIVVLGCALAISLRLLLDLLTPGLAGPVGSLSYPIGLLIVWLIQRLRPTYYRIVPGRMDIMRFSVLTNRATILDRWDLRNAHITVRFERQRVGLGMSETKHVRLFGLAEPHRFVAAVFQGAISTHEAPPLPDDALLG